MRSLVVSLICGLCLLLPAAVNADTLYWGSISYCGCQVYGSPSPFSIHYDVNQGGYFSGGVANSTASASAGPTLGASSHAWVILPTGYPASVEAGTSAGASFTNFEVVISGPPGQQGTISLNMTLNGTLSATGDGSQTQSFYSAANLHLEESLSGSLGGASFVGDLLTKEYGGPAETTTDFESSGILSGFQSGSGSFTTLAIPTVTGDHIFIIAGIGTSAYCEESYGSGTFSCDAIADFAHTLEFPTNGPVFNLPDGWTADSVDGSIVNNHFVAPGAAGVPEPSSLVLMGSGLIGLARWIRKRS